MSSKEGSRYSGHDIEKSPEGVHYADDDLPRVTVHEFESLDDGVPRNKGIFAKLWKIAHRFDAFGAEARGIERVRPEDRPTVRIPILHRLLAPLTNRIIRLIHEYSDCW